MSYVFWGSLPKACHWFLAPDSHWKQKGGCLTSPVPLKISSNVLHVLLCASFLTQRKIYSSSSDTPFCLYQTLVGEHCKAFTRILIPVLKWVHFNCFHAYFALASCQYCSDQGLPVIKFMKCTFSLNAYLPKAKSELHN